MKVERSVPFCKGRLRVSTAAPEDRRRERERERQREGWCHASDEENRVFGNGVDPAAICFGNLN